MTAFFTKFSLRYKNDKHTVRQVQEKISLSWQGENICVRETWDVRLRSTIGATWKPFQRFSGLDVRPDGYGEVTN